MHDFFGHSGRSRSADASDHFIRFSFCGLCNGLNFEMRSLHVSFASPGEIGKFMMRMSIEACLPLSFEELVKEARLVSHRYQQQDLTLGKEPPSHCIIA